VYGIGAPLGTVPVGTIAGRVIGTVVVAIGTVVVAIGTVERGLVMGVVVTGLAMGTVVTGGVTINGRCSGARYTVSFFLPKKGIAPSPQQANNTQQISNMRRNHAHHGQPPPSVVVAVVVVQPPVVVTDTEVAPAMLVNVCVM